MIVFPKSVLAKIGTKAAYIDPCTLEGPSSAGLSAEGEISDGVDEPDGGDGIIELV